MSENQLNSSTSKKLGEILVEKGLVSKDQIEIALREQQTEASSSKLIGQILVELGFITEVALSEVLSETSGMKNLNLKSTVLDSKLVNMLPKEIASRCKVIPVSMDSENITVAVSDIYNILVIDQIKKYFPKTHKISLVYAPESQILESIDQYYKYEMSIEGILKEIESIKSNDETMQQNLDLDATNYVNPTVRLVDAFLVDGIKSGASDIHFEPEPSFIRVRYRIDGNLKLIRSFHKKYWPAIVVRIKILSKMNIAETRNPQDGRISYNILGRMVDFRVATQPTIHGENIVMRILDSKQSLVSIEQLGFTDHNSALLKKLILRPEGIIIVTGPTGSGKTTTLYSILSHINTIEQNIMTLEDPVEYQLPLIRQTNIKEGANMNFIDGIKSLMRQDPDVIFVGEIRDNDTATMAIRAAMTGHQVYSTLHTNDAIGAIPRLKDIGVSSEMLSGVLICIIAQRLTRKLCDHCKEQYEATADECKILEVKVTYDRPAPKIYRKKGCEKCSGIGYKGRIAISEILHIDKGFDELIATNATRQKMHEYASQHGFIDMLDDGAHKILQGITDIASLIDTIDVTSRI